MNENSKGLFHDVKESFFGSRMNSSSKATITIALMGVLIALSYVFERILYIPVGDTSRYSFTFVIYAIAGLVLGGLKASVIAAAADIIGSLILFGNVNPLITLCVFLGGLFYGLILYKISFKKEKRVEAIVRIVIAAVFYEIFCSLILKTGALAIWYYGGLKAYPGIFTTRLVQAAIMTPIEIVVLFTLYELLFPVLKKTYSNMIMN